MKIKVLLTVLAMFITTLCYGGTARAATCDQVVGDDAGLFGTGSSAVVQAAQLVAANGAMVRIRTTASLGTYNNIPGMINACASWRAGNGQARSNLLVFVLYRDPATSKGKANVYAGGYYQAKLNAQWQNIKTAQIGPKFNAGDYSGAAIGGLNGINTAVFGAPAIAVNPSPPPQYVPPPAPVPVVTAPPVPAPAPVVITTPSQPTEGSSTGWWVFLGLLLLGGGGAAYFFARKSKAANRAAQQNAKNKATSCATELEAFSAKAMTVLDAKVAAASKGCSADEAQVLTQLSNTLKTRAAAATQQYGRLSKSANPDDDGKAVDEYHSMEGNYDSLLVTLGGAKENLTVLENKLGEIKRMADQAQPAVDQLGKDIETAAKAIADAETAGYKTGDLEQALAGAMEDQEKATAAIGQGRHAAATSVANTGSAKAKKVCADAKTLAVRKSTVESRISQVKKNIAAITSSVETARQDFAEIQIGFAASSWQTLRGNVNEAVKRTEAATQKCEDAAQKATLAVQDWVGAEKLLGEAESLLSEADALLVPIAVLKQRLSTAKTDAPIKIAAAKSDVDAAMSFVKTRYADIQASIRDGLLQQLREEIPRIPSKNALSGKQPDYLAVIDQAKAVSKVAAEVRKKANDSAEATVRTRAEAAAAINDASTNIEEASNYLSDYAHVVGAQHDGTIRRAQELLDAARRDTGNPANQLSIATQASNKASNALQGAKQAVYDKEQQELRQQREQEARDRQQREREEYDARHRGTDNFATGVVVGAAIGSLHNNDNGRRYDGGGSSGGLMGGGDDLGGSIGDTGRSDYSTDDSSGGGGGLMSGNDDLGSSPSGSDSGSSSDGGGTAGGSNDDL